MNQYRASIRVHGKTQLEIKNKYPLTSRRDRSFYRMEAYIYTPGQLGITGKQYGVDQFFSDVKSHTRFSISYIPIARLTDPGCSVSPLTRIMNHLAEANLTSDLNESRILYELRTLANLISVEMKATYRLLCDIAKEGSSPALDKKVERFLGETENFLLTFRDLHTRFMEPAVTENLRTALDWADESISLSVQKMLFYLYRTFSLNALSGEIEKALEGEKEHRRQMGYPSVVKSGEEAEIEQILYREGTLKKWAQTVLYMSSEDTGSNRKVGHILAGVAAATAMSFAVVATFFAERLFAVFSVPWALVVVVSYILKDRIKEILRGFLVKIVPRAVSDRSERLVDKASNKKVGKTRSMVRFIRPSEVPSQVRKVRNAESNPFRSILPPENVLHFSKDILLDNRKLLKEHTRVEAITEILRIKLDRFLEEMDASKKLHCTWKDGEPISIKGKKVYHINLILLLTDGSDEETLYKYRLILSRQGVQRIEETLS
jgi:hypothetical protein